MHGRGHRALGLDLFERVGWGRTGRLSEVSGVGRQDGEEAGRGEGETRAGTAHAQGVAEG